MRLRDPDSFAVEPGRDPALDSLPPTPAVFLVWLEHGPPYLGRAQSLRRRLSRLLGRRPETSRLLNLSAVARQVDYWLVASRLESALVSYELGRIHYPETFERLLRLPRPAYVKLILTNRFPRTQVTSRISGSRSLFYGPFPARAAAEQFESQFLEFFQIRRCQEDLAPSPDHPGCIYGEMRMCLRPCQQAVTEQEYASETARVSAFLESGGASLLATTAAARERLSEELEFEQAAKMHQRYERIQQVLRAAGDLAREVRRLHGVAVTASIQAEAVELWFMLSGIWRPPVRFSVAPTPGKAVSLDSRLRQIAAGLEVPRASAELRQHHLGLLARWYYSSFRDGEWLPFDSIEALPYRKLVHAIHRVASA
ncbi:MAG TPA: hypothetical protein VNN17_01940 [Terriglobia bacterium]|nr:hypothetical protein [Terriglobia bacterium]